MHAFFKAKPLEHIGVYGGMRYLPNSKKWQYKIVPITGLAGQRYSVSNLDRLGQEGWEAVGIFFESKYSQTLVLLKREYPHEPPEGLKQDDYTPPWEQ